MSGLQIKGAKRRRVQVVVGTEIARHPVVVRPLARCDAESICSERAGPSRVACMHHGPPRRGRRAWRWKRGRPTHTPTDLQPCWLGGGKEAVATCATRTAVSRGLTCGPPARLKAADAGRSPARQTSLLPPPHLNSKLEFWLYWLKLSGLDIYYKTNTEGWARVVLANLQRDLLLFYDTSEFCLLAHRRLIVGARALNADLRAFAVRWYRGPRGVSACVSCMTSCCVTKRSVKAVLITVSYKWK